jgi:hypothetical protein
MVVAVEATAIRGQGYFRLFHQGLTSCLRLWAEACCRSIANGDKSVRWPGPVDKAWLVPVLSTDLPADATRQPHHAVPPHATTPDHRRRDFAEIDYHQLCHFSNWWS